MPKGFGNIGGGKFGLQVLGATKVANKFLSRIKTTQSTLRNAMNISLLSVEREAKILIATGYYRPAIDTGRLRNSINSRITIFSPSLIEGVVGTSVYYSIYVHQGVHRQSSKLDFGSFVNQGVDASWRMKPRPFLTDAIKNKETFIINTFRLAVKKGII